MKYLLCLILIFLLVSCAGYKIPDTPQEDINELFTFLQCDDNSCAVIQFTFTIPERKRKCLHVTCVKPN